MIVETTSVVGTGVHGSLAFALEYLFYLFHGFARIMFFYSLMSLFFLIFYVLSVSFLPTVFSSLVNALPCHFLFFLLLIAEPVCLGRFRENVGKGKLLRAFLCE